MESREHRAGKLLLLACVISFVCFFGSYMRIPIVPLFATSLGADTAQVGLINSAFMLMAGALSIPSGLVSDRLGRRIPLLGGLILLAGSSFLLYWSNTPLQMGGSISSSASGCRPSRRPSCRTWPTLPRRRSWARPTAGTPWLCTAA